MRRYKRMVSTEGHRNKQEFREKLREDTEKFLASGGQVKQVPYGLSRKHLGPKK